MADLVDWIPFLLFVALGAAATALEIRWLAGRGWATAGRASAFVLVTNLLALILSGFVVVVILLILLMMVFGPSGQGSGIGTVPYAIVLLLGLALPASLLITLRRIMLAALEIRSGSAAWTYSLASSFAIIAAVIVLPSIAWYLLAVIPLLWK